jgi:hypothetical protein
MNGIGLREAAEKYHVPRSTLSGWASRGLIRKVQERLTRGQPVLLYEPDVAALAATYTPGRTRWNRPSLDNLAPTG